LKILLLTTDTPHHAKFVDGLKSHADLQVVAETKPTVKPGFLTASELLSGPQEAYELKRWFNSSNIHLRDICEVHEVDSINDEEVEAIATEFRQDLALVYGTSILSQQTIWNMNSPILNFHGGDPQHYRGLDSHLWCAYHSDWESLKVALHVLEPTIDTGPLVALERVGIEAGSTLEQLRAFTTEVCISIISEVIPNLSRRLHQKSLRSYTRGRYYSHMPASLLDRSRKNYDRWSAAESLDAK